MAPITPGRASADTSESTEAPPGRRRVDRSGHDGGEEPGPEAVLLVQADVLGALGEGEQAGVAGLPRREDVHGRVEQPLGDATVPVGGRHGERTEEADTAPVGREVGPDQLTVDLGGHRGGRVGRPAGADELGVAEEVLGIGSAEEGAERQPEDPVGPVEVGLDERADDHLGGIGHEPIPLLDPTPQRTAARARRGGVPPLLLDGVGVGERRQLVARHLAVRRDPAR